MSILATFAQRLFRVLTLFSRLFSSFRPSRTALKPPLRPSSGIKTVKRRGFIWGGHFSQNTSFLLFSPETGLKQAVFPPVLSFSPGLRTVFSSRNTREQAQKRSKSAEMTHIEGTQLVYVHTILTDNRDVQGGYAH